MEVRLKFGDWLIVPVLILALVLRGHNYAQFPVVGETQDEVAWTYLGSSLLADHVPTSWSYFKSYGVEYQFKASLRPTDGGQTEAPLVRPVLDHPPLFSLLPGLAHWVSTTFKQQSWLEFPAATVFRAPMILLGTLNVFLLYLAAKYILPNKKWALLAALFYAVWPAAVFSSRLVVAENLIITWELLALGLIWGKFYQKKWGWWSLVLVAVAAVLSKVSGLVVPATIIGYGLLARKSKIAWAGVAGGVLGVLAFAAYGAIYDWQLFLSVLGDQSGRMLGLATFHNRFLLHPALVDKFYFDGLVMAGLFAAVITLSQTKFQNSKPLSLLNLLILINLAFIVLTSGEQTFHGWYDYMLYPLFVLSLTQVWQQIADQENYTLWGVFWILLLPIFRWLLKINFTLAEVNSLVIRGLIVLGFVPLGLLMLGQKKLGKTSFYLLTGLLLVVAVIVTWQFQMVDYWEVDSFFLYR